MKITGICGECQKSHAVLNFLPRNIFHTGQVFASMFHSVQPSVSFDHFHKFLLPQVELQSGFDLSKFAFVIVDPG